MKIQSGYSASHLPGYWRGSTRSMGLAACMLLLAGNGNAASQAGHGAGSRRVERSSEVRSASMVEPGKDGKPSLAARESPIAVACPSLNFEIFLRAFANSAEIQSAYSSTSSRRKYPYYWKHNTEPGDPMHPKWAADEDPSVGRVKYRYDPKSKRFIWVGKSLKNGQHWRSVRADEKPVSFAQLPDFEIRRISNAQYDVHYGEGEVDTYELEAGCWRFSQHLDFEKIVFCRWPDQCRSCREWEGEGESRALCETVGAPD